MPSVPWMSAPWWGARGRAPFGATLSLLMACSADRGLPDGSTDAARLADLDDATADASSGLDARAVLEPDGGSSPRRVVREAEPLLTGLSTGGLPSPHTVIWTGRYFVVGGLCGNGNPGRGGLWIFDETGALVGTRDVCIDSGRGATWDHTWSAVGAIASVDADSFVVAAGVSAPRGILRYRVRDRAVDLEGAHGGTTAVAVGRAGDWLMVQDSDGLSRVYDARTLEESPIPVRGLFSPCGSGDWLVAHDGTSAFAVRVTPDGALAEDRTTLPVGFYSSCESTPGGAVLRAGGTIHVVALEGAPAVSSSIEVEASTSGGLGASGLFVADVWHAWWDGAPLAMDPAPGPSAVQDVAITPSGVLVAVSYDGAYRFRAGP